MAPMEGLTGYIFRNAYHKYFNDIDKYFTPFISSTGLNHKELNDVLPEHNKGFNVVPQILTNKAANFLEIAATSSMRSAALTSSPEIAFTRR